MRRLTALFFLAASPLLAGPAEEYLDAQLSLVEGLGRQPIVRCAELAADRLIAGGRLHFAGEPGIVAELSGRAGGLCRARRFAPGKTLLTDSDVVLASHYSDAPGLCGRWVPISQGGTLLILTCPNHHPELTDPRVSGIPTVLRVETPLNHVLDPFPSSLAHAAAQWAFVAELIGACRRRGRQLAVYLSIHLDEERKRYQRTRGLLFEPDVKVLAAPNKGEYAKAFLDQVRAALQAIRRREIGNIRKAAAWIREARGARGRVLRLMHGHLPPHEAKAPWDPGCFSDTVRAPLGEKGAAWARSNLREGDVFVLVGYQQNEDAMAAAANALGARTVFITSLPPSDEQAKSPLHVYVNPHWPLTDACLDLPGYDVKACPLSAICGLTCYYAIAAEAVAAAD